MVGRTRSELSAHQDIPIGIPAPPPLPSPGHASGLSSSSGPPPGQYVSSTLVPTNAGFSGGFPPEMKGGSDWFMIFNPEVKRVLDVSLVHTLTHDSVVCCVRFSSDGKHLATGCNRTAQIYDTTTGAMTRVLTHESPGDLFTRSVCFSPDGQFLATGSEDGRVRIWDIAKRQIHNIFDGHQQEVYALDFSPDGRLVMSGSEDKTVRIWDVSDGSSKVLTISDSDSPENAGVATVAISPNGHLVAAGSLDKVVRIWDVASGALVERLQGHEHGVYSVAFTPDGRGLVSGSLDKTLKYWDVSGLINGGEREEEEKEEGARSSRCTMDFKGHKDYVLSVVVSHDGQWVVSGSKDHGVQFWDSKTAIAQCVLYGHKNSVISIDVSPAGNFLASGGGDRQVRIWSYTPM